MQFTLSSCFVTPSESVAAAVLVVDCPNLNRPPAFLPTLHHSSITLAALFSSSLFPLITNTHYSSQSRSNIYTLQQKHINLFVGFVVFFVVDDVVVAGVGRRFGGDCGWWLWL